MTPAWIWSKADAYAVGWRNVTGQCPSRGAVVLGLAVAVHETRAGDAWPGSHNWGACTLRSLTAAESSAIAAAGLRPTVGAGHEAVARAAQDALVAAGFALPQGEIHCDSAPGRGAYFVWFASFPSDWEGAAYMIRILVERHPDTRAILESPHATPHDVAASMYAHGYYTGFYDRHGRYRREGTAWVRDDVAGMTSGATINVDAYASALRALVPEIDAALATWTPPADELELTDAQRAHWEALDAARRGTARTGLDAIDALMVDGDEGHGEDGARRDET